MNLLQNNLKIVFAGGGPYAEPIFDSLTRKSNDLTLLVKKGTPKESGVCLSAKVNRLKILEVSDKGELHAEIDKLEPDLVIVVSFGIIISENTLTIPKHGFINVHYSLLPKYRGPSPVQAAILAGESVSGITFQKMAPGIDEGSILYQERVDIKMKDTTETLAERMAKISAEKLPEIIDKYTNKLIQPFRQSGIPSYSKIIQKTDGKIDWNESADVVERKVRAYTPWPSAYTFWNGKMLKILEAMAVKDKTNEKPGTFIATGSSYGVQTGGGILLINKLQLEGKKPLKTSDFLLGHQQIIDEDLT